jgi:NADPH2:quinone reductase
VQAAFYVRQGGAEVLSLGDQPMPEPGPEEVRVRLRTSGVNPSDWKARKGGAGRTMKSPLVIPHSDGAGDIDAVGEHVPAGRIGQRVWIWNGQWQRAFGTAAEYICVPSRQAVALPEPLDYAQGACLGIPACTAMQAVRLGHVGRGTRVLIAGGAGAVGHYAIQMAKARGAVVLTTVSSDAKAAHARSAGADHVINYRSEDVAACVHQATAGAGVDVVIEMDLSANAALYPRILRPHAKVVVYGMSTSEATLPSLWLMQNSITLQFFLIYEIDSDDRRSILDELDAMLRAGRLHHTIGRRLPLSQVAYAHDLVEQGVAIGNVVLDIT